MSTKGVLPSLPPLGSGSWKSFPMWDPRMQHADDYSQDEVKSMKVALARKTTSIFCLEPPGFSPPRKSIVDSLLSGCIPVLFYDPSEYPGLMPHYFGTAARLEPARPSRCGLRARSAARRRLSSLQAVGARTRACALTRPASRRDAWT